MSMNEHDECAVGLERWDKGAVADVAAEVLWQTNNFKEMADLPNDLQCVAYWRACCGQKGGSALFFSPSRSEYIAISHRCDPIENREDDEEIEIEED